MLYNFLFFLVADSLSSQEKEILRLRRENREKELAIQDLTDWILKIRINLELLTEKKNEQIQALQKELSQSQARIQSLERKVGWICKNQK